MRLCSITPRQTLDQTESQSRCGCGLQSVYHSHTHTHTHTHTQVPSSAPSFRQKVGYLWIKYLHEDPVKRDEERWQYLSDMQRRKEEQYPKIYWNILEYPGISNVLIASCVSIVSLLYIATVWLVREHQK